MRIEFPQPAQRLSLNDRMHWAKKAGLTRQWRRAAFYAAREIGAHPPATIRVTFPVTNNRRRDPHNMAPTIKAIIDGLVDAGVWVDDTDDYVIVMDPRFSKDTDKVIVELHTTPWGTAA